MQIYFIYSIFNTLFHVLTSSEKALAKDVSVFTLGTFTVRRESVARDTEPGRESISAGISGKALEIVGLSTSPSPSPSLSALVCGESAVEAETSDNFPMLISSSLVVGEDGDRRSDVVLFGRGGTLFQGINCWAGKSLTLINLLWLLRTALGVRMSLFRSDNSSTRSKVVAVSITAAESG